MKKQVIPKNKRQHELSFLDKLSTPPYSYLVIWILLLIIYGQVATFFLGKFDEEGIILANLAFLKDFGNIGQAFFRDAFFSDKGVEFYRPLQNISFMLDAHLSGNSGWGYYLMNLLLHGTTSCLLFYLFTTFDFDRKLALSVTLVFATNPLFVHLIAWAPSRGDLLIGMFGLLSFIGFRKYFQSGRMVFLSVNALAFLLAMLSKETAIFFPLIFVLDYFLLEKNRRINIRRFALSLMISALIVLLYFLLRHEVVKISATNQVFGLIPLLQNLRTILEFPGKFVFPLFLAPIPAYSMANTLLGTLVLLMLAIALYKYRTQEFNIFLFSASWYLLFVLPGMMYTHEYGSAAYDYLEQRAYLPMIGFLIFLLALLSQIQQRFKTSVLPYFVFFATMIYGIGTFSYVSNYQNPQTFYDLAVRANPGSALAFNNRGLVSESFKDFQGAMQNYEQALKIKPDYPEAFINRGMCYNEMGNNDLALKDFLTAIKLKPDLFQAHYNIAKINYDLNLFQEAKKEFELALKIKPSSAEAFLNRGRCRYLTNDTAGACTDWAHARQLGSKEAQPLIESYCRESGPHKINK